MSSLSPQQTALFIFFILSIKLIHCSGKLNISCPEIEKQSLLTFKSSLKDPANRLSSWKTEGDCCNWKGVFCSNLTGHVHQLRLQSNPYIFQGLSGQINPSLLNLKHLRHLDLSLNNFGVPIPSFIGSFAYLQYLNLSFAGFRGTIPHTLGNLSHLHTLDLAVYPDIELADSVQYRNQLDSDQLQWLSGLSKLEYLNMNSANLSGATDWPKLSGEMPDCWMQWSSLGYLNLGDNKLSGIIPDSFGYLAELESLNLYRNKFSDQMPLSMRNFTKVLKIDVADNNFGGSIPAWISASVVDLQYLILRSNNFSGEISASICGLKSLQIMDLSNNNFSGMIPSCINNLTAMATVKSLDNKPASYSDRGDLIDSALISTKGNEYQYDTILFLVTSIDLSKNNLSGEIPKELTSLVELRSLNLSENQLTGPIPDGIGDMKQMESLDLSRNSLSGKIPESITLMSSLSNLDLSNNKLTGKIPESTQLRGFDAWSFAGNSLCGPPLPHDCSNGSKEEKEDEGGDESQIEWFYVLVSLGYAVGVLMVCGPLLVNKSWREAYFGWLESMWDKLYVFVCVKWRRLLPPSTSTS